MVKNALQSLFVFGFIWLVLFGSAFYRSLPCGGLSSGYWKPTINDYAGLRVAWALDVNRGYSIRDFLDCLSAHGFVVTTVHGTSGSDAYLASRDGRVIANGDGLGNTFTRRFLLWR